MTGMHCPAQHDLGLEQFRVVELACRLQGKVLRLPQVSFLDHMVVGSQTDVEGTQSCLWRSAEKLRFPAYSSRKQVILGTSFSPVRCRMTVAFLLLSFRREAELVATATQDNIAMLFWNW